MLTLVLKRLALAVPSLIGVVIVTFLLTRALPGDPAAYFAGPAADKVAIEQIRVKLGLDQPLPVQFVRYVSDLARGDVVAARDFIAKRGYKATLDDIRRCRQDVFALDEASPPRAIAWRGDFYASSDCRDLLFHVQEHRFTLPQIKGFLVDNGLGLLGFEHDADVLLRYRARFPDDPACTDLDHWHAYEQENPRTFARMYQFVVQKRT